MKKLKPSHDPRVRRAILSLDVEHEMNKRDGVESFMDNIAADAIRLANAILERKGETGFHGHQLNYVICKHIAKMQIRLEQAKMVWSSDNVESFAHDIMNAIETSVRNRRAQRLPRNQWPRCENCGCRIDTSRPHGSYQSKPVVLFCNPCTHE